MLIAAPLDGEAAAIPHDPREPGGGWRGESTVDRAPTLPGPGLGRNPQREAGGGAWGMRGLSEGERPVSQAARAWRKACGPPGPSRFT